MNMRLKKVLDDIQKTENKILELQEHVRQLRIQKKQMEDITVEKAFNMFMEIYTLQRRCTSCKTLFRAVRRDNRVAGGHGS